MTFSYGRQCLTTAICKLDPLEGEFELNTRDSNGGQLISSARYMHRIQPSLHCPLLATMSRSNVL